MGHGDYEKLTPETIDALWARCVATLKSVSTMGPRRLASTGSNANQASFLEVAAYSASEQVDAVGRLFGNPAKASRDTSRQANARMRWTA